MIRKPCCPEKTKDDHETIRIEKTGNICPSCETYSSRQETKPIAILCCEGACLKGEIARRASNILCHKLAPDKTVRICLGGAFTQNTGQRHLVAKASRVLALEGCFIQCSSRMMKGAIPHLQPEVIQVNNLYEGDPALYGVDEMPEKEIQARAEQAARQIAALL